MQHYNASYQAGFMPNQHASLPVVYEQLPVETWQYRIITIDLRENAPLDEENLTPLGSEGWLLCGIVQPVGTSKLIYYFLRSNR